MTDIFVSTSRLDAIADALIEKAPQLTRDDVLIALGDAGDIWPLEIAADVIRAGVEDCERALVSDVAIRQLGTFAKNKTCN